MLNKLKNITQKYPALSLGLLGALGAVGFAPLFWWPVTVVCFGVFFLKIFRLAPEEKARFIKLGFSFYFGFSVAALWWIGGSFRFTDSEAIGLMLAPLAVIAIGIGFGIIVQPFLYGAWQLWHRLPLWLKPPMVALIWVAFEALRTTSVWGLPWHLLGYTLAGDIYILQAASVGGVWLLSALVILPAAAYAARPQALFTLFWMLPLLGAFFWGATRIEEISPFETPREHSQVKLFQPNTEQGEKWQISVLLTTRKVLETLENTRAPNTLSIFPEVAITMPMNQIPNFSSLVGKLLGKGSVTVIGVPREVENGFHNSMVAVDDKGRQLDIFDKQILVPFGEYMPLRQYLPSFVKKLAQGGDYLRGTGPRTLELGPFGAALPIICYESAFAFPMIRAALNHDLSMIINLTNDGWFDGTTGGYQHLAIARVRSVETGLPQLRVANTGITAIIDAYGRIEKRSILRQPYQIEHLIPRQVETPLKKLTAPF